ncbi:hypothetical protein VQL36_10200 [Chengkuizengella sp. SCS-71B]|uniref:hypothetical protein n=1 Tax=Chengkuizengella sp. SCS-71B TaxID=3115290 RepID=UPI0032C2408F
MSLLFNSMPLPLYLFIAWGSAIGLATYYLKNTHKYYKTILLSMLLISSSAFFAGIFKITSDLELFPNYIDIIEILALPGLLGVPLFMIGGYMQVKDDPYRRKIVIYSSGLVAFCIIGIITITVLVLLGK